MEQVGGFACQALVGAIKFVAEGNKEEVQQQIRGGNAVEAQIKSIDGETWISGNHTGKRIMSQGKRSFGSYGMKRFYPIATGEGQFISEGIQYTGLFFNNLFDDVRSEAQLVMKEMKYTGCFQQGKMHGRGRMEYLKPDGFTFYERFRGFFKNNAPFHGQEFDINNNQVALYEKGQRRFTTDHLTEAVFRPFTSNQPAVIPEPNRLLISNRLEQPYSDLSLENSMELLTTCVRCGEQSSERIAGLDSVVVLGNTGAGKSTLINYLFGCTMASVKFSDLNVPGVGNGIVVRSEAENGALNEIMPIGHARQSKTFMPQVETDPGTSITFCDCPGFLDNRGAEINIANAVNIRNVMVNAKGVRVIVLINFHSFAAERGKGVNDLLTICSELFGSVDEIQKSQESLLIGISKAPKDTDIEEIKEWLSSGSPPQIVPILLKRLFLFDPISENDEARVQLLEKIQAMPLINEPSKIFQTVLTDSDQRKLVEIGEGVRAKILHDLAEKDFSKAFERLQHLQSLRFVDHIAFDRVLDQVFYEVTAYFNKIADRFRNECLFEQFNEAQDTFYLLENAVGVFGEELKKEIKFSTLQTFRKECVRAYEERTRQERQHQQMMQDRREEQILHGALLESQRKILEEKLATETGKYQQLIDQLSNRLEQTQSSNQLLIEKLEEEKITQLSKKEEELNLARELDQKHLNERIEREKRELEAYYEKKIRQTSAELEEQLNRQRVELAAERNAKELKTQEIQAQIITGTPTQIYTPTDLDRSSLGLVFPGDVAYGTLIPVLDDDKQRQTMYYEVRENGLALGNIHPDDRFRSDSFIILTAVKNQGWALQYACAKYRGSRGIVLSAVSQNGLALCHANADLRKELAVALAAVRQNGLALQYVDKSLTDDHTLIGEAVKQNGFALQYASVRARDSSQLVSDAVRQNGLALEFASERLKANQELVLLAVNENGLALKSTLNDLNNDRTVVTAALKQNPLSLAYVSPTLKSDRLLVFNAVNRNNYAFLYVSKLFEHDISMILTVLQDHGEYLEYASSQKDRYLIVLAAVKQNGLALEFASSRLQNDKSVVLAAVSQNGLALQFAHEDIARNRDVVLAAVKQNGLALQFAGSTLRENLEVAVKACEQNTMAWHYLNKHWRELNANQLVEKNGLLLQFYVNLTQDQSQYSVIKSQPSRLARIVKLSSTAVKQNGLAIQFCPGAAFTIDGMQIPNAAVEQTGYAFPLAVSAGQCSDTEKLNLFVRAVKTNPEVFEIFRDQFLVDRNFMIQFYAKDPSLFEQIDCSYKNNHNFILDLVEQNHNILTHGLMDQCNDRSFALDVVKRNGLALEHMNNHRNDREIVEAAIFQNALAFHHASEDLRSDLDFVLAAISQNIDALAVFEPLCSDREFILKAVAKNGLALKYASPELRLDHDVVLAAISQNIHALAIDKAICSDREFILKAVAKNGLALQYARKDLRSEPDVVLAALSSDLAALSWAPSLCVSRDFMLNAVAKNGLALQYASEELRSDHEIAFEALSNNAGAVPYTNNLCSNSDFMLEAATKNTSMLTHANALCSDAQFVRAIILKNGLALQYVADSFREDEEIVMEAIRQNPQAICYIGENLLSIEFAVRAVSLNPKILEYAPEAWKKSEIVNDAAKRSWSRPSTWSVLNAIKQRF